MEIDNSKLKEIMESDPDNMTDEDMENFINEFMNADFIILCEMEGENCPERRENGEFFHFDDIDEFDIIKLEDDEEHEFIPVFTGSEELVDLEVPGCGVIVACSDLINLLFDNQENNEQLEGLIIDPFTEYAAEVPYMAALELFGLVECADPNCEHEHHHHHH